MSLRARAMAMIVLLFFAGATACSTPPAPDAQPICSGADCNGKEPSDIKCDAEALSITSKGGKYVKEGEVEGALEIRKSRPALCRGIYWARFTPAPSNTGAFEVTLEWNGTRTKPQKSEPQNPSVQAWTTVFFAEEGDQLRACVLDVASQREVCTSTIEVV